ncbi:MAG: glycosyltransferase [Pseudomonadota bacterium]
MSDDTALPVVALVTAYNEAATIGAVVETLLASDAIARVHVVDDASTDATADIARAAGAAVTTLPTKVPVGEAIIAHLDAVTEDCLLLWCDADLVGLKPHHADALIARYRAGGLFQTLSSRGVPRRWPGWLRALLRPAWAAAFGPISGERVMRRADFAAAIGFARSLGWAETMRGYGVVLFLNWYGRTFGGGSEVLYFDDLAQRQKYKKWGLRAAPQMARQWLQFAAVWLKIRRHDAALRRAALNYRARPAQPSAERA